MGQYCYTCGTRLQNIEVQKTSFNVHTGKPETFWYSVCPTAQKQGWWDRLWHITNDTPDDGGWL